MCYVSAARLGWPPKSRSIPSCLPRLLQFGIVTREVTVPTRTVQLKDQSRSVAACRKALERCIPADATRSLYTTIRRAFISKLAQWYVSAPQMRMVPGSSGADDLAKLEKEWTQLAGLLSRNPPTVPNRDWRRLPTDEAKIARVLRHALRAAADQNSRGRPVSALRRQAVLALDLQSSDSKRWNWRSLTNHLCNCGLRDHPYNSKCQKNLRREALLVKEFLRELGIRLPTQRSNP
jgi:hypothetical protein